MSLAVILLKTKTTWTQCIMFVAMAGHIMIYLSFMFYQSTRCYTTIFIVSSFLSCQTQEATHI